MCDTTPRTLCLHVSLHKPSFSTLWLASVWYSQHQGSLLTRFRNTKDLCGLHVSFHKPSCSTLWLAYVWYSQHQGSLLTRFRNTKDLCGLHVSFHKPSCSTLWLAYVWYSQHQGSLLTRFIPQTFLWLSYVCDIRNAKDSLRTRLVPQTLLFNIMISTCLIFATATSCDSRPSFGLSSARLFRNSVNRICCRCSSLCSAQKWMWQVVGFQMTGRSDSHRLIMWFSSELWSLVGSILS